MILMMIVGITEIARNNTNSNTKVIAPTIALTLNAIKQTTAIDINPIITANIIFNLLYPIQLI